MYDPSQGWRVYGKGAVTADGAHFAPETGVGVHGGMPFGLQVNSGNPAPEPNEPPCHQKGCDGAGAGEGSGTKSGDPIDLRTGAPIDDETDVAINDIIGLDFGRSYSPHDLVIREFGLGTRSSYGYNLYSPDGGNTMQLVLPNGVPLTYTRTGGSGLDGTWQHTSSTTNFNGSTIQANDSLPYGEGFLLTRRDGSQMFFGSEDPNPLQWIQDRFGNRLTFTYDGGFLSQITTPSGRFVQLSYNTSNLIDSVTDSIGRAWTYGYNDKGLLSTVTYPDKTTQQYGYFTFNVVGATQGNTADAPPKQATVPIKPLAVQGTVSPFGDRMQSLTDRRGNQVFYNTFQPVTYAGLPVLREPAATARRHFLPVHVYQYQRARSPTRQDSAHGDLQRCQRAVSDHRHRRLHHELGGHHDFRARSHFGAGHREHGQRGPTDPVWLRCAGPPDQRNRDGEDERGDYRFRAVQPRWHLAVSGGPVGSHDDL